ncbi:MAG: type II CAAX endopeptidase family protein [Terracidiphilus sp.]
MTLEPGQSESRRAILLALGGLAAAVTMPLIPIGRWVAPGAPIPNLLSREAVWWVYAAAVLIWLGFVERLPLSSIGFRRPGWKSLLFGVLGAGALLFIYALHFGVIVRVFHLDATAAIAQSRIIHSYPIWFRALMVLRAAVVEEILFRGYIIEKVRQLTGSVALAIAFSVLTFTLAHLAGWGVVHLIPVFGAAIVLAVLYVWRRDLPSNMLAHFLTDSAAFLLG